MQSICRRNKYGYCYFGDTCRNKYINVMCADKSCNIFSCENRHPKICTFFRDLGQCKFNEYCKFDHNKQKKILENNQKIEELEKKIEKLQRSDKQSEKIAKVVAKLENIENSQTIKDISFENKINPLERHTNRRFGN